MTVDDCEMLYDFARIIRNVRELEVPGYVCVSMRFNRLGLRLSDEQLALMQAQYMENDRQQILRVIESGLMGLLFWRCRDVLTAIPTEEKNILVKICDAAGLTQWEREKFIKLKESPQEDPNRRIRSPTTAELNAFCKRILGVTAPEIMPLEAGQIQMK